MSSFTDGRDEGAIFRWWNRRTLVVSAVWMCSITWFESDFALGVLPFYDLRLWFVILIYLPMMTCGGMLILSWVVNWIVGGSITIDQNWLFAQGLDEPTLYEQITHPIVEDE